MRIFSFFAGVVVLPWLVGCTGLAATAALSDCMQQVSANTPSDKEVDLTFHLTVETVEHQRIDMTVNRHCRFEGFSESCQFSSRGSRPQPIWSAGLPVGPQSFKVKDRRYFVAYPDCKTAFAWRLPRHADSPESADDPGPGDGTRMDYMASTAYRFLITDESGKALEGNPMSDYVWETHGFRVVWATIY